MVDEVRNVIEKWQSDERLASFDEPRIKSAVIEPILRGLGWDTVDPDEVWPEYPVSDVEKERVDYALLIDKTPKVFIEVKRGSEPLDRHQRQFVGYAFHGVQIAVLTNGITWWFYLPIREVSWERRRVATVQLNQRDSKEIDRTLNNLLSRENVNSGAANQNAERHQILETLPGVWNRLVSEPNSPIFNLLAERTHKLCVREPDRDEVEQFFSSHSQQIQIMSSPAATEFVPPPESTSVPEPIPQPNPAELSKRTTCRAFTFCGNRYEVSSCGNRYEVSSCGNRYEVSSWRNMIVKLCEIINAAHSDRFEEVLNLRGTKRSYFSRNPSDLDGPRLIGGTDIFVDAKFKRRIGRIVKRLIPHFGYDESDLSFETRTL